jgi:hypothetical protein
MPYFHFTNYVRTKWKLNEKEIIDILFTFFKSHGLNLGWLHKKTPLCNESLLILLDLKNERNFEDKKGIKNLKNLLSLHLKRLKVDCLMVKKRKWSEDEYVRLINGAIRHHSSPNMFINNDLVYNFFLTRSLRNAINDGWRVLLINGTNIDIIEKAMKWTPSEMPFNEHLKLICENLSILRFILYA